MGLSMRLNLDENEMPNLALERQSSAAGYVPFSGTFRRWCRIRIWLVIAEELVARPLADRPHPGTRERRLQKNASDCRRIT
jgi:hypothetical protein